MRVYGLQIDIVWERKGPNHERVLSMLSDLGPESGSLVVLPEMFASGFSMNVAEITDSGSNETEEFLAATASRFGIYLLGGVVTSEPGGRGRNESVVYDPAGKQIARYQKIRPFTLGGEAEHYRAGAATRIFEWGGFNVAPFICYDLRFPELFRVAAARGANLFTVIANWPAARISHWECLLRARAIENQAYVIGVNRCGRDPYLEYPGRSLIIDPSGAVIAEAGAEETVITAELDREHLDSYRRDLPFLADLHRAFLRDDEEA